MAEKYNAELKKTLPQETKTLETYNWPFMSTQTIQSTAHRCNTARVPWWSLWMPSRIAILPSSAATTSGENCHVVSPFREVTRCCTKSREVMSCGKNVQIVIKIFYLRMLILTSCWIRVCYEAGICSFPLFPHFCIWNNIKFCHTMDSAIKIKISITLKCRKKYLYVYSTCLIDQNGLSLVAQHVCHLCYCSRLATTSRTNDAHISNTVALQEVCQNLMVIGSEHKRWWSTSPAVSWC